MDRAGILERLISLLAEQNIRFSPFPTQSPVSNLQSLISSLQSPILPLPRLPSRRDNDTIARLNAPRTMDNGMKGSHR